MLPGAAAPGSLPFAHDGFDSARGPCTFAALRTLLHDGADFLYGALFEAAFRVDDVAPERIKARDVRF